MNRVSLPQVMISVAQNRALVEVLGAIVRGLAQCPFVRLARIWLVEPGDLCASCSFRDQCPDKSRCLHLAASAGNPTSPTDGYTRLDGSFRRFPLGLRKVGRVGATGEPIVLAQVKGDEDWIARPEWVQAEGIRTVALMPLAFRDQVLGVLGLFDSQVLQEDDIAWLRVLADHAAVSIANARAFEEIETLKARLQGENEYLRDEISAAVGAGDLFGQSPGMRKVHEQVALVAPTTATVLITGESGTGKELVARAVHEQSPRRNRPFIKVNCSAVPQTLFESEFFGHAKGAFTGAVRERLGRFELADGGTLLLDEIGEVPLAMQAKLLRVLQEQEVERVGDPRPRPLDVRILAATNRDLQREVEVGRFRSDLYYRLSVFPIAIPPLRGRGEDIPALAMLFAQQAARRLGRPTPRLGTEVAAQLKAYDWPGNVRELQNAVERAVILASGGLLHFDLDPAKTTLSRRTALGSSAERQGPDEVPETREEMRQRERDNLSLALVKAGGRISGPGGAAEILGMKPTTLASRMRVFGLVASGSRRGRPE